MDSDKVSFGKGWVKWITQAVASPILATLRMQYQRNNNQALTPEILKYEAEMLKVSQRGTKATKKGIAHNHAPSGSKVSRMAREARLTTSTGRPSV